MIMSDSGPDFFPTSVLNMIYCYRLFKKLDLDISFQLLHMHLVTRILIVSNVYGHR